MADLTPKQVLDRHERARERRAAWESLWRECYDFALPQRTAAGGSGIGSGSKAADRLFDGTAADAVDQLSASLLAQLTPPWARWFGLSLGRETRDEATPEEQAVLERELDTAAHTLQSHFDRSTLAVELHQCYLDLVTVGTACLLVEEAPPAAACAFRFTAVPMADVAFEEGPGGRLDGTFRRTEMTRAQIARRFPDARLPDALRPRDGDGSGDGDADQRIPVIDAVLPDGDGNGYRFLAVAEANGSGGGWGGGEPVELARGRFAESPFIGFRWLKAPGEIYGRSPVMKALPDIKTANKVVELVLKNASIAVTGIWQADDDGVLNPATIRLTPGTIIPKAVGSAGLTPLEAPGRFDISQLVLEDLRARIRGALLTDRLGQVNAPRMTATEVLERSAEMARVLGATFGRLQSELLTPLVSRAIAILRRRGEIPAIRLDGRLVDLEYRSPLARQQVQKEAGATLQWLEALAALGPEALAVVDPVATARWLAKSFAVPEELMRDPAEAAAQQAPGMTLPPEMAAALAGPAVQGEGPADA